MHASRNQRLDQVVEEIVGLHRAGGAPDLSKICVQHPELADEIRRLYPTLVRLESMRHDSGDDVSRDSSPGILAGLDNGNFTLGDFRIVREIGRGGMGIVYEAVQESLGRRVALKILPDWATTQPQRVKRFEHEARAAAGLHHSNIVPVLGVGSTNGLHYIVMQLIDGCALDDVIAQLRRATSPGDSTALE